MPQFFESTWIKGLEMRNRSVRSATWTGLGDGMGRVTDRAVEFYAELGRGGIGLIVTGYQYIMTNGQQLPNMIGNYEDGLAEGLGRLAEAVHGAGGRVVPQLVHTMARSNPSLFREGDELWGPSGIPEPADGPVPKEMTKDDIRSFVEAYAAAAARSKAAGFDGIQLHGAHGYGINQFLSEAWNRRGDSYGGSLSNRYRVLGEIMEAIRAAVGNDFPVLIKLNGQDFVDGGLTIQESVRIAQRLVDDGMDAIEVSGGCASSPQDRTPARRKIAKESDEAYLSDLAAAVKSAVTVPVITVGGIRSLSVANKLIEDRKADYVAMSRPFIREPHLVERWKSGDESRASCISCNGCFETGLKGDGISCKVERVLREKRGAADPH
ncbi:MAG: NADH:flavin oxidoreductase [Pseudomonadota bacterium]